MQTAYKPESKPLLSICIPTFNRPDKLIQVVEAFCQQWRPEIALRVLDNHSPTPPIEILGFLFEKYPNVDISVHRHITNIGGPANLLRCFESGDTEWLWIVGDDDLPSAGAVAEVIQALVNYPEAVCINFQTSLLRRWGVSREEIKIATDLSDCVKSLDNFSNFLFISANAYRRDAMLPFLRAAYLMLESGTFQVALVLLAMERPGATCVFHSAHVMNWGEAPVEDHWNYNLVARNVFDLLRIIESPMDRRILAGKIAEAFVFPSPDSPKVLALHLATSPAPDPADFLSDFLHHARLSCYMFGGNRWRDWWALGERIVVIALAWLIRPLYRLYRTILRPGCAGQDSWKAPNMFRRLCEDKRG